MQVDLKRSATLIEMLVGLITILGVVISAYVTITSNQARQDERIKALEGNYRDIGLDFKDIKAELRELNNKHTEILLELKDKQDRTK